MRPVRLDLDGFASYRQATSVDFTGADYFALIGPTGSGKSTIIDAITFALYGTVPRWMDQRMVTPALAPTATRGVVRLVFDADGRRYVVAREVRRSGGRNPKVSVVNARLERLLDPDEFDGDSETLASEGQVRDEVERLLGLRYDHFTTCVALPQNQFMQFLHAKPSERQDILSTLLGHQLYEDLRARAGARSRDLKAQAEALDGLLGNFADATAEHVAALAAAAERTEALRDWLTGTGLGELQHATDMVTDARQKATELGTEQTALAAATVPAGAVDLDTALTGAAVDLDTAARVLAAAETAEKAATDALSALRPRHELERLRDAWTQRVRIDTDLPDLLAELAAADQEHTAATRAREDAEQLSEHLRQAADTADRAATDAAEAVAQAEATLATLAGLTAPTDFADLAATFTDLDLRRRAAAAETAAAETACTDARDTLTAAASESVLATADRAAHTLRDSLTTDLAEWDTRADEADALSVAVRALTDAEQALTRAQEALDQARRDDQAGELRAHLVAGGPCPVCEQTVAVVPSGDGRSHVTAAADAVKRATTARDSADRHHRQLERATGDTRAAHAHAMQTADRARGELHAALAALPPAIGPSKGAPIPGKSRRKAMSSPPDTHPFAALTVPLSAESDRDTVVAARTAADTALTVLATAAADRGRLVAAVEDAEHRRRSAGEARAVLDDDTAAAEERRQRAGAALTAARDTVTHLAPPSVDLTDPAAGWDTLNAWAAAAHTARDAALPGLREVNERNALRATQADEAWRAVTSKLAELRGAESKKQAASVTLTERCDQMLRQRDDLDRLLSDEPAADKVDLLLIKLTGLEQAVQQQRADRHSARDRLISAQQRHVELREQVERAWDVLRAARDPLTRYGAPNLTTDGGLAAACAVFTAWVATQRTRVDKAITKAGKDRDLAERGYHAVTAGLATQLAEHGLTPPDTTLPPAQLATALTTVVTKAAAETRSAADQAAARVSERATLEAQRAIAIEQAQVAATLANLLRSDAFQAWLLDSALQSLVADASDILLEMSSGQFELRAAGRDLEVVDHNDADATRPVRTLSGGETFQASLALALALSRQVSSLAAAGAAKLESIFLDEGFGTLDDSSLDVVATTLETLASSGERVVGVITHVQALADRVPVRFQVTRTGASSSIERVTT